MTEMVVVARGAGCGGVCGGCGGAGGGGVENGTRKMGSSNEEENQLSLLELILAALKKSMAACRFDDDQIQESKYFKKMEIGCPTDVQHLTHVTFDRFHGFLGLPVEFQVEIPSRVPSASVSVFGVSAESMQCSYDSRGNSVPTILLLMQKRLYDQGGLKAEGIFRINPENSHEEHVRDQLNRGRVPEDIEVHCLAGLIKAWFRELPCGVLDGLSPDEVLQCNTEEERVELVKQLKPTETALLNWAIDLMSDVAEQEESNKMNSRNIAMVFAPNMTQMSDPLTALMHAVQVMNLLKTLITKTLREREETTTMTGGFSPTWGPLTDDEFNHHEEMQTSCELRRQVSSEDEEDAHQQCSDVESISKMQTSCELRRQVSSEDEEDAHQQCSDVESLSKMEENFLEQIKENKNAKDRFKKELEDLVTEHFSPTNRFKSNEDSLGASLVSKESETGLFNVHYTNL